MEREREREREMEEQGKEGEREIKERRVGGTEERRGEERRGEERRGGMTYMWNYRRQVKKFAKALKERLATEREIKYLDIFDDMLATDKDDLYAPFKFDGIPTTPSPSSFPLHLPSSFSLPLSPLLSLPIFMN